MTVPRFSPGPKPTRHRTPPTAGASLGLHWHTPPQTERAGATVCATGVFDLLHVGHLRFLAAARASGATLIVGVEDDARTHARKGFGRPVVPGPERCELLAALEPVDGVFLISGPTDLPPVPAYTELLAQVGPTALAFTEGDPAEPGRRRVAEALGIESLVIPRVAGRSTTLLIELFTTGAQRPDGAPNIATAAAR